jgi:hypothetical protein
LLDVLMIRDYLKSLETFFQKIVSDTERFSCGASSNVDESVNATKASEAPASGCYSMTPSADFRNACAAGHKTSVTDATKK